MRLLGMGGTNPLDRENVAIQFERKAKISAVSSRFESLKLPTVQLPRKCDCELPIRDIEGPILSL